MSGSGLVIVQGRSCAGCTLCCKIMAVPEYNKPRNQWCGKCDIGRGCKIYADRPQSCRDFRCIYLLDASFAEHWKPSRSHMVLTRYQAKRLCVQVDPDYPNAWRQEPFYSDLKAWSRLAAHYGTIVAVYVGDDLTIVLPDRDEALGRVGTDKQMRLVRRSRSQALEYDVELLDRQSAPVAEKSTGPSGGSRR